MTNRVDHIRELQNWLGRAGLGAVIVPSTDEFLSEFSPPPGRRLRWATGFMGSMGTAVISRERAVLFLDGRYRLQGSADTAGAPIEIAPPTLEHRRAFFRQGLDERSMGIAPALHSGIDFELWRGIAQDIGVRLVELAEHPIDALWTDRPPPYRPSVTIHPAAAAGLSSADKTQLLSAHLKANGLDAALVADPEDVSWLLNLRADKDDWVTPPGEWHIVPYAPGRALLHATGEVDLFIEEATLPRPVREAVGAHVLLREPTDLVPVLSRLGAGAAIVADPRVTPANLVKLLNGYGAYRPDDVVARHRWRKNPVEVAGARRAHLEDAIAVISFMARLKAAPPDSGLDELDAANILEAERTKRPLYLGPSMPLMSAVGANGAMPHHVPLPAANWMHGARRARRLNEHPIYWMDSGGHYFGGSTDNTITLALASPEPKHVEAHTFVLKSLLNLSRARFPRGTCGYHLDPIAREPMWQEGLDYAHGTGHGVGNYLNIHEGPSIGRDPTPNARVPLEPSMIVSNEPAYYSDGDFGLRLETHMLVVERDVPGFLEFETISRLPIDAALVDFELLDASERAWLSDYHQRILEEVTPLLEPEVERWLRGAVEPFFLAAESEHRNRTATP